MIKGKLPAVLVACALAASGCGGGASGVKLGSAPIPKVGLDLSRVDGHGLAGPPGGKVALGYEFCIPEGPGYADEVRAIDATLELMPGSRGRIRCGAGQVLCIGSTRQPDWRGVLTRLAALAYVDSIGPFLGE